MKYSALVRVSRTKKLRLGSCLTNQASQSSNKPYRFLNLRLKTGNAKTYKVCRTALQQSKTL